MLPQVKLEQNENSYLISNLHELIVRNNLNEAKLARITNIPQPTLHKILTGKTADPRVSTLKILADYFNVTIDQLYVGNCKEITRTAKIETQLIPVLSWSECLQESKFINTLSTSNWKSWISVEFRGNNLYALISKPAMTSAFPIGSILVVDSQKIPKDGDLIVVYFPNAPEGALRKLTIDGLNQLIAPLPPNLPLETLTDDIKILGTVIQSKYTFI